MSVRGIRLAGDANPPPLGDILRAQAHRNPGKIAIIFEGRETSYGELERTALQTANALLGTGLTAGERVAILAKNSDDFFTLFLGAAMVGIVLVPINWRLSALEIAYIVDDAGVRLLFAGEEFLPLANEAIAFSRNAPEIVSEGLAGWRGAAPITDPAVPVASGDVAIQLYTSGTTGQPKGALLSHHALNSVRVSQPAEVRWSQWTADDVCLISMPLFHVGGIGTALASLYHGARMVIAREFAPQALFDFIEQDRITRLFLVPAAMQIILDHPRAREIDYSRIKYILYGSSPISPLLLRDAMAVFGCGFVQLYGMTETSGTIVALPPEDHGLDNGRRMRSAGKPLSGVEIAILDDDGERLPPDQVGEVAIRSAANMLGYWGLPEATASCFTPDGFLRSGDAGYLDDDGYLYIHDRMKDMIISGGENIYAAEVEAALAEHPAVAEVAVIGVPDPKWGEAVKAIIVVAPGAALAVEDLRLWARERLAGYKVPKSMDLVDALPKNAAGKLLRRLLREPFWEGQDRAI